MNDSTQSTSQSRQDDRHSRTYILGSIRGNNVSIHRKNTNNKSHDYTAGHTALDINEYDSDSLSYSQNDENADYDYHMKRIFRVMTSNLKRYTFGFDNNMSQILFHNQFSDNFDKQVM